MKAAALTHQYLSVKSYNKDDSFFGGGGRFRGSRKIDPDQYNLTQDGQHPRQQHPATDPLSRRPTTVSEQIEPSSPSAAILGRSISESASSSVLYKSKVSEKPKHSAVVEDHKPYSLKAILDKRRGSRDEDDALSGRVKRFYKQQDEIIDSFEEVHRNLYERSDDDDNKLARKKRHIEWLIRATVVCNCSLLIAKIVAAVFSKSLSIISSVVDSAVDSASACLLFWAVRAIKKRDPYTYPGGRTRLEPVILVILSVVMVSASVQVIYESAESLMDEVNYFTKNSTELRQIDMGPIPITVMCVTVVCKAILSFLCFQISNPTMRALGQDHLNDVFSNVVALVCGILAAKALQGVIHLKQLVVIDPVGAIVISLYIIFCWLKQLREQIRNLSGYAAEPEFIQKITWITLSHSPLIEKIDTVRAFHFGVSFLVEVELILPESMSLKEAHDIGASLQTKLEVLPEVELAFVHLDYTVDPLKY